MRILTSSSLHLEGKSKKTSHFYSMQKCGIWEEAEFVHSEEMLEQES